MHVDENVILEKTKGKKEERNDLSVDFVDEGKGGGKINNIRSINERGYCAIR